MRNTTLLALFGTAAATAPTLATDCKTKNALCTADLCWTAKAFNTDVAYKLGCADFNTAADKCKFGDVCTADFCWTGKTINADTGCTKFDTIDDKCKYGDVCTADFCWTGKKLNAEKNCKTFDTDADKCQYGGVCTVDFCWTGKKLNADTGCKTFDTDADKCQYGGVCTTSSDADKCQYGSLAADKAKCTNTLCAGKKWASCDTCINTPYTATCWSKTDAAENCQWGAKGCTVDICKDHEVFDEITTTPAKTKAGAAWGLKYWSEACTYAKVQDLRLAPTAKDHAAFKIADDKDAKTLSAAKKKESACADKTSAPCKADAKALKIAQANVDANTAFESKHLDSWQAQALTACKATDTDAACEALKKKDDASLKKAKLAESKAKKVLEPFAHEITTAKNAASAATTAHTKSLKELSSAKKAAKYVTYTKSQATLAASEKAVTTCEGTPAYKKLTTKEDKAKQCKTETEKVTADKKALAKDKTAATAEITTVTQKEALVKTDKKKVTTTAAKVTSEELKAKKAKDAVKTTSSKTAQVQVWVNNVDDALTNDWGVSDQIWLSNWAQEKYFSAQTLAEVKVLQAATNKAYSDALAAEGPAMAKVTKDEATVVTDKKTVLDDTKLHDAALPKDKASTQATLDASVKAQDAAVTAHTAAVTAHDTAVKKTAFLLQWKNWADAYTINDWSDNDTDKRFLRWMVTAMKQSATKVDAQVFQTKNVKDLAAAKKANDDKSSVANKAKVAELEKWVAEGNRILTNSWKNAGYEQDWQFTWWKNKCIALKTKHEMMKEHVQNTVDLSDTEKKLDAATKLQASTANEVTAAKARVSAKDLKMEHLRADRDTSPAKLENYNSAVNAYDIAVAHQTAQIDAHNAATADVKEWTAKQTELKAWLAWGEARITNTYQPHQITWMKNKIAGMEYEYSAKAIQAANVKALAAHKAATATGAALVTLKDQIAQETSWVADGKAALLDPANLNVWHANALENTTTVKTAAALLAKEEKACPNDKVVSDECTWVKNAKAHLKKLTADQTARDAVNTKAAAKVVLADKKAEGTTKAEARAELAKLRAASSEAEHHLAQTKEAVKVGACSTDNADTIECEDLVRKQDLQEAQLAAAKAAVAKQLTYLNTATFPESDDAAIAIIILCVSAFICIAGGFLWHWWGKKQLKKEQENAQRIIDDPNSTPEQRTKAQAVLITVNLEQKGDKDPEAGDMEGVDAKATGVNFYGADADDRFTAMVDAEY